MNRARQTLITVATMGLLTGIILPSCVWPRQPDQVRSKPGATAVHEAVAFDVSPPLGMLLGLGSGARPPGSIDADRGFGTSPGGLESGPAQSVARGAAAPAPPRP
jgi:hypothetical protein